MAKRLLLIGLITLALMGCDSKKDEQQVQPDPRSEQAVDKADEAPEPDVPSVSKEELEWIPDQPADMEPLDVAHVPTAGQAARGASEEDALVTIVEFGDYGCPDTEARRELVRELLDEYGDHVRYVYRNVVWVPGEYGPFAANLAMAAAQNDQYWKSYEIIWQRFRKLEEYGKESYLEPLGLTLKDLQRAERFAKQRADENNDLAKKLDVQWVPTFFVNGVPLVKLGDEDVQRFVEVQIAKSHKMRESRNLKGEDLYKALVASNKEHQEMAREGKE